MLFKIACFAVIIGIVLCEAKYRQHSIYRGHYHGFIRARCFSDNGKVKVNITITQYHRLTKISGEVTGLTAGKHGFHIHQYGDLSNGCISTGGHYNPFNNNHGSFTSAIRHVGDLGNINANQSGVVIVTLRAKRSTRIRLTGRTSVLGRAIVVHGNEDDLGLADNEGSRTTGNAGGRVACCVIGRAETK